MSTFYSLRWFKQRGVLSYGAAVLSVVIALLIARLLQVQYHFESFVLFICAMIFSTWFGGVKPGLLAVALSLLAFHYYFLFPIYPSGMDVEMPRLLVAAGTSLLIVILSAAQASATEALRESELRFRRLVEVMPVAVYVCDMSGIIQRYNNRALELWGRAPKSGDTAQRFCGSLRIYAPDGRSVPHEESPMAKVLRTGVQVRDVELVIERPDGSRITVVVNIVPMCSDKGELIGAINCFQDITERKQAEEVALQNAQKIQTISMQKEEHLRLVIDTIPAMAWSVRPDGVVDFLNKRWLDYTGLSLEQYVKEPTGPIHPDDIPRVLKKWHVNSAAGQPTDDEMRLRRADGEYRWFLVRTVPLRDAQGNIVKWYGTSTDIEDRKRAEHALRGAASQLEALSRRLVDLQESERKELARELHDRIGQSLTALNINLKILGAALPSQASDELRARLADSEKLIESTTAAVGNVMSELHPPMLDDHGLVLALDWYARQFSARTGLLVAVRGLEPAERPAPETEIALFRIAQEALNNVVKHARASQVEITIERSGFNYVMSVKDDGVGFDAANENAARRPGLGMVTMRERAQAVGGRFEVRSMPTGGTRLTVQVPA